ncbi:MAG: ATP-binding cassette domain-containing protein, partial [Clostridia bacterium]|nr:ATP-binding cassette domain-containing protein [Clostridia bacterium]
LIVSRYKNVKGKEYMAFLRIANLRKSYRISKNDYQEVLKGVNVEFKRGELVAILGESGCGKSTFMNILGGLDNDYTGTIMLEDENFKDYTDKQLDDYRKSTVGMIFQNYNLINHMTIAENVEIAMTMNDIPHDKRKKRARALLKQMGLEEYADKLPNQLSGGQRQRVSIARALANAPAIILADEPTGALDKESADHIMKILKKIASSGRLVIVVTHSQKVASECSRIISIDDGVVKSDVRNYDSNKKFDKLAVLRTKDIKFSDITKLALSNIKQSLRRSVLVSVGMSIGIIAVILVFCLSSGLTNYVNTTLADSMNTLQLQVRSSTYFTNADETIEDFEAIPGVDYVVKGSYLRLNSTYDYGGNTGYILMLNTSYDALSLTYEAGGKMSADNEIIISQSFAKNLYSTEVTSADDIVGTEIDIIFSGAANTFTVSGVYEDSSDYADYPCAYVTSAAMRSLYSSANKTYRLNVLYVYVEDTSYISSVTEVIEDLGYSVSRDDETVETMLEYIDLATMVLTGFACISLVVSAIMIFIVTYISVIERVKEIGILRAVGGRKKDVTRLFITESAIIGATSGLLAIVVSLFISIVANLVMSSYLSGTIIAYNVLVYLIGFVVSVAISVVSGLMPAMQAAQQDPAEALRCD